MPPGSRWCSPGCATSATDPAPLTYRPQSREAPMRTALALLFVLLGVGTAAAQQPSAQQSSAIRSACRNDYQTYCSSVPTGGQASLACLQQNAASLSPACQQAVGAVGGSAVGGPAAGGTAAAPPAASAPPAAPPPAAAKPPPAGHPTLAQMCAADHRAFCGRFAPGTLRAAACLHDNMSRLSPGCRQA